MGTLYHLIIHQAQYNAQITNISDYYAFGSPMAGRQYNISSAYRYGFNGKEKDDEVKGAGATYDYGFRIYDSRLGRFESVDPLSNSYPWFTPYQFAGNKPISSIDLDGLEDVSITNNADNKGSCMEIVYTANDIATIIDGKRPELRITYKNSGKTTDQFEGPNKVNENAVFNFAKPLLEKSGVTEYIKDKPTDDNIEFKSVGNNYEVPLKTAALRKIIIKRGF